MSNPTLITIAGLADAIRAMSAMTLMDGIREVGVCRHARPSYRRGFAYAVVEVGGHEKWAFSDLNDRSPEDIAADLALKAAAKHAELTAAVSAAEAEFGQHFVQVAA